MTEDIHSQKSVPPEVQSLTDLVERITLPPELKLRAQLMLESLHRMFGSSGYSAEYDQTRRYLDWACALPWVKSAESNLNVDEAHKILDSTHYGLDEIKERILEYISILKLQDDAKDRQETQTEMKRTLKQGGTYSPVLFLVGLPGIGKTSIASTIAQSMNRPFVRIAMGGMGDALQLRGRSRSFPGAEPGQVIKNIRRVGVNNPVILLDEIDRVAESGKAEIMGVLLELLDPEQNMAFTDYYIDYPFDLSKAVFLCSANNTGGISNAVLDRMEVIQMPGYNDEEKTIIARDYLLPRQLTLSGLSKEVITFDDEVWPSIVRPLGFDAGIRTMERTINAVVRKVAKKVVLKEGTEFHIDQTNVKDFLPE